jgi:transcriptional regulator with XRE-family HTH domain
MPYLCARTNSQDFVDAFSVRIKPCEQSSANALMINIYWFKLTITVNKNVTNLLKTIGQTIKYFRKLNGANQATLADALNLSHRHLQKIEAGDVDIKASTLTEIAQTLEQPACYLAKLLPEQPLLRLGVHCKIEILDLLHVGVQITNTNGLICYSNRKLREILEITETQIKNGIYIWDALSDSVEVKKMKSSLELMSSDLQEPSPIYTKRMLQTGEALPIKIEYAHLKNKSGALVGHISVVTKHPCW